MRKAKQKRPPLFGPLFGSQLAAPDGSSWEEIGKSLISGQGIPTPLPKPMALPSSAFVGDPGAMFGQSDPRYGGTLGENFDLQAAMGALGDRFANQQNPPPDPVGQLRNLDPVGQRAAPNAGVDAFMNTQVGPRVEAFGRNAAASVVPTITGAALGAITGGLAGPPGSIAGLVGGAAGGLVGSIGGDYAQNAIGPQITGSDYWQQQQQRQADLGQQYPLESLAGQLLPAALFGRPLNPRSLFAAGEAGQAARLGAATQYGVGVGAEGLQQAAAGQLDIGRLLGMPLANVAAAGGRPTELGAAFQGAGEAVGAAARPFMRDVAAGRPLFGSTEGYTEIRDAQGNPLAFLEPNRGKGVVLGTGLGGAQDAPDYLQRLRKVEKPNVKRVTVNDVGSALQKVSEEFGFNDNLLTAKTPDAEGIKARVYGVIRAEVLDQLKTADNTGHGFYTTDVKDFDHYAKQIDPELAQPGMLGVYHAMGSIASSGQNPQQETNAAFGAWDMLKDRYKTLLQQTSDLSPADRLKWMDANQFRLVDLKRPDGKSWGMQFSGDEFDTKVGRMMVAVGGPENYDRFMLQKMPYKALQAFYNSVVPGEGKLAPNISSEYMDDKGDIWAAFMLGPKIGSYYLNKRGVYSTVTKDFWVGRSLNRVFGQLLDPDGKINQSVPDFAGKGLKIRKAVNAGIGQAAQELGLEPAEMQEIWWAYEHNLYERLGVGEAPLFLTDGAKKVAAARGIKLQERPADERQADLIQQQQRRQSAITRGDPGSARSSGGTGTPGTGGGSPVGRIGGGGADTGGQPGSMGGMGGVRPGSAGSDAVVTQPQSVSGSEGGITLSASLGPAGVLAHAFGSAIVSKAPDGPSIGANVLTLRKAGLLASPSTHLKNVLGNAAAIPLEEASRIPASIADIARVAIAKSAVGKMPVGGTTLGDILGTDRQTGGADAGAMWRATQDAATIGVQQAAQLLKTGQVENDIFSPPADLAAAGQPNLQEYASRSKVANGYVNGVFRALSAEDRLFRVYAYRRSLEAQARLLAAADTDAAKAAGQSIDTAARARELAAAPTDSMHAQAIVDAETATFNNDNPIADAWKQANGKLANVPGGDLVGGLLFPFVKTPTNVLLRLMEYVVGTVAAPIKAGRQIATDVGNQRKLMAAQEQLDTLLKTPSSGRATPADWEQSKRLFDDTTAARGALRDAAAEAASRAFNPAQQKAFAETFGRGSMGLGLLYLGWALAKAGLASGANLGQGDSQERDKAEIPPGSINIGGTWYRVDFLQPIGSLLTLGATIAEQGQKEGVNPIMAAGSAIGNQIGQSPILSGVQQFQGLGDPGRINRFIGSLGGSFIPSPIRQLAAAMDTTKRRPKSIGDYVAMGVPGQGLPGYGLPGRQSVPPYEPVTDEQIMNSPDVASLIANAPPTEPLVRGGNVFNPFQPVRGGRAPKGLFAPR